MHALPVGRPFARNRPLQAMVAAYLGTWLVLAVDPVDRQTWLLENLLVFVGVAALVAGHGRLAFSNLSYALITLFLLLHAVGSHYTYSLAPPGFWLQDALGLGRNHYDRIVHFAFGLLLFYPLRELARRRAHVHGVAAWLGPLAAILALSSSYEIVEGLAARVVDPAQGTAFVGAQGDEWDAQKDMALAFTGGCLALAATAALRRASGREPWGLVG